MYVCMYVCTSAANRAVGESMKLKLKKADDAVIKHDAQHPILNEPTRITTMAAAEPYWMAALAAHAGINSTNSHAHMQISDPIHSRRGYMGGWMPAV